MGGRLEEERRGGLHSIVVAAKPTFDLKPGAGVAATTSWAGSQVVDSAEWDGLQTTKWGWLIRTWPKMQVRILPGPLRRCSNCGEP